MKWGLLAALATAVLMAVSRDTGQFGWLMLMAPVPLMVWSLKSDRAWPVAGLAFVAGVAGEAGPILFYSRILTLIYAVAVLQGLMFALAVLFLRALYRRGWPAAAVIGYAVMTAALEYLYGLVSPNGSFGALGYDLVDVLPLLQAASLGGVAALSFLAAIIPAGLSAAMVKPRNGWAWAAWTVPALAAVLFGLWSLHQPAGEAVRVTLVSDDRFAGRAEHDPAINIDAVPAFSAAIAAAGPADIVVLPEKMFAPGADFAPLADSQHALIVAGIDAPAEHGRRRNLAAIYAPGALRGTAPLTYSKQHMVPGLEAAYIPGDEPFAAGPFGVAICKDMDFAAAIRPYAHRDVGLMLVPAWDFGADRYLHGRMAVVRAVENGFALARTASDGLMTVADSHGRIVAEAHTRQGPAVVTAVVPLGAGHSLYSRIGDAFAQVLTVAWLGLLGALIWRRREA